MIPRDLLRAHLPQTVPTLLADHSVVVLTFVTADEAWAVHAAWDMARAAARAGRRTALVDLSLEHPTLHESAVEAVEEGIVDAFLFETSLNHVARAQNVAGLHFIGAGTMAPNPREVWGHKRWTPLARGFAKEGALMLLFVPVVALPYLTAPADGVCVLADEGLDTGTGALPEIGQLAARGAPLLGVVTERSGEGRRTRIMHRAMLPRTRSLTPALATAVVLVASLGTGGYLLGKGRRAVGGDRPRPAAAAQPVSPGADADNRRVAGDTLYYSVQVAAFQVLSQAMALARDFERSGFLAPVTPVQSGSEGIWYRVLVGAVASPGAADSMLRELWRLGLVEQPQGSILRTPEAFALGVWSSVAEAREALRGLRDRGIPAYIVPRPDGTARLYMGAFTGADQADAADSLLARAGLQRTLVARSGVTP
jgi:cell division septation protein DedD